jgi:drug/metabolite transporter (DMT)-like permease
VSPEHVRAWIRVVRDAVLILAGTATFTVVLALYVVRDEPPNLTLIGAASAFFGLGVVLRADELIVRNGNGNGGAKRGAPP